MTKFLERVWSILISLRLAVCLIVSLAISLSAATIIESKYDTATARFLVYQSTWFFVLLGSLGVNILAVALSRWPWKKKHFPFLLAHAGIISILIGSWLTYVNGLDGSLRISEGEVTSTVELDDQLLVYAKGESIRTEAFPWTPEFIAQNFKPKDYPKLGIHVERFIADAETKVSFTAATAEEVHAFKKIGPALEIKILGSPMGGAPEIWLWGGDAGWSTQKIGPVRFLVRREDQKDLGDLSSTPGEAKLEFIVSKKGTLRFEATSIRGEKKSGSVTLGGDDLPLINPGWRMPIQVQVKKFVPDALNQTEYVPVVNKTVEMGSALPNPAVLVSLISNPKATLWLGLGDRAEFTESDGSSASIGYFPRQMNLPVAIRLKQFEMKHNPGTTDASAYSSYVQVVDAFQKTQADLDALPVEHITMNEPMKARQYTFYQASYIPDFPRPTTTILSVNYDPGRFLKYWGSITLILGAISLYLSKVLKKKVNPVSPKESHV